METRSEEIARLQMEIAQRQKRLQGKRLKRVRGPHIAPLAHSDRAPGFGPGGAGFKSLGVRHSRFV